MLDQLVESKSNSKENKRRSEFLVVVLVVVVSTLMAGWTYSLFAKDFGMGGDDLALTTLVAPVPVPEDEPPPKPEKQPEKQPDVDVRKELIQNILASPKVPEKIETQRNPVKEMRLDRMTKLGDTNADTGAAVRPENARAVTSGGEGGLSTGTGTEPTGGEGAPPPPPPKKAPPKMISGGVLNSKAISLPKPAYPAAARAVHAGGAVTVQIVIDESGRVVSASAASGHPMLRAAAVQAAQGARFSPTLLSGQPVKVSGIITYNFTP
jgi:periplasmic protein TonB